jgi:hypothetical protein
MTMQDLLQVKISLYVYYTHCTVDYTIRELDESNWNVQPLYCALNYYGTIDQRG